MEEGQLTVLRCCAALVGLLSSVACGGQVDDSDVTHTVIGGWSSASSGGSTLPSSLGTAGASMGGAGNGTTWLTSVGGNTWPTVHCPGDRLIAVSSPACGDSALEVPEQCDDGNGVSGDGCDSRCRLEADWICLFVGQPCTRCGNCRLDDSETCDDGNHEDGDGCSSECQVEPGYVCGLPTDACLPSKCGDGRMSIVGEVCDDGNSVGGDGCSADCTSREAGFVCRRAGEPCIRLANAYPKCGDGFVQADLGEQCDEGVNNGSDCTIDCQQPRCGDGQVQPGLGETCDDGVLGGAFGECSFGCGFYRPLASVCGLLSRYCGDGIVESQIESCDNGAENGLDGKCTTECTISRPGYCGDARLDEPYEQCDDGNLRNCDGCTANCQIEFSL